MSDARTRQKREASQQKSVPSTTKKPIIMIPTIQVREKKGPVTTAKVLFSNQFTPVNCPLLDECRTYISKIQFRANSDLIDLDSQSGKTNCSRLLQSIAMLLPSVNRIFRKNYSNSYQKLLCDPYIPDILDAAQEAFPFMWVNGEKYVFSEHVLLKG